MGGDLQSKMYGAKKASVIPIKMGGYNNKPLHKLVHYNGANKRLDNYNSVSASTNIQIPEIRPVFFGIFVDIC